jgi:hypothetical protein
MAAGGLVTFIAKVPWRQVVENAPKLFEAASKLWDSVTKKSTRAVELPASGKPAAISETESLKSQLSVLSANVATLQEQMMASSQLIKNLAEQNTLLVSRVELSRVKHLRLVIAIGVAVAILLGMLVLHVAQH